MFLHEWIFTTVFFTPPFREPYADSGGSMLGILVFYNPPNSDMDYRIFSMRTWSCALRVHTKGDKALGGLHIS